MDYILFGYSLSLAIGYSMEKIDVSHLISTILNNANYVVWAQEIFKFFKGRKLWHYAISDILHPIKSLDMDTSKYVEILEEWDSKNYQIITRFYNTCASSIKLQFGCLDTTKKVWDLLLKCYSITNAIHQCQLYGNLSHMHQKSG